ncbi:MAG: ZIP family metal transporter [Azonexus sp.]|jgi:zinc and cadmium transporter|nr:ZIP family metal transporter [Azonexus sp.]
MNTLTMILLACLAGGLISIAAAAALVFRLSRRSTGVLVAFAAGAMLSTAFLDVLPEAFTALPPAAEAAAETGHGAAGREATLFALMLATLFVFFALERLALWRHSHGDCAHHDGHHATTTAPLLILVGDTFHNFIDGILIAAAFIADPLLGVTTTIAIIAHEIPQEMGDFILLRNGGWSNTQAFIANGGSSLSSIFGGILGYFMLASAHEALPYVLVISASSFIYVALADLLPLLHKQGDNFWRQSALIAAGVAVVPLVGWLTH